MYLARFSYNVLPANRQLAIGFIKREVEASRRKGSKARLLIPLTRPQDGAALQFEVELTSLDQLETLRHEGGGSRQETAEWMRGFSDILLSPPVVELLRVEEAEEKG